MQEQMSELSRTESLHLAAWLSVHASLCRQDTATSTLLALIRVSEFFELMIVGDLLNAGAKLAKASDLILDTARNTAPSPSE